MKMIGVNEAGRRVGEDHPAADLSDREIELMRDLHENHGIGYRRLARMFEVPRARVQRICKYRVRAQRPTRFKRDAKAKATAVIERIEAKLKRYP